MNPLHEKYQTLVDSIAPLGTAAVALSGGVDSALLLKAACDALGGGALAITALSPAFPRSEREDAHQLCQQLGVRHLFLEPDLLGNELVASNPPDRCYHCKQMLFRQILAAAAEHGVTHLLEGSNVDDLRDYRPGLKAIRALGVHSPLQAAGLTKAEIRQLSREFHLHTWEKPSCACLMSRFPYGERITEAGLRRVGQAEDYLHSLGFTQVRVRAHGTLARIEGVPPELSRYLEQREAIHRALRALGFAYVTLDLEGYRTGSLNEVLPHDG